MNKKREPKKVIKKYECLYFEKCADKTNNLNFHLKRNNKKKSGKKIIKKKSTLTFFVSSFQIK